MDTYLSGYKKNKHPKVKITITPQCGVNVEMWQSHLKSLGTIIGSSCCPDGSAIYYRVLILVL